MNSNKSAHEGSYRWWILTIAGSVNFVVIGASLMCMPVLFSEISQNLGLHLQQLLLIWSMVPLANFIVSIPAGAMGDRFGVRWVCGVGLLACTLLGASRALAFNFPTFIVIMFLFGASMAFVGVNLPKILGVWFPFKQLGLANGIVFSLNGIGAALALGLSATVLSPVFGGWQNVFYICGGATALLAFLWLLTVKDTPGDQPATIREPHGKIVRTLRKLLWKRQIVILCLIDFLFIGAYLGFSGSAPFLLEKIGGWSAASAHSFVSIGLCAHVVGCLVMPTISDHIGLRRPVLGIGFLVCGGSGFFSLLLAILLSTNWMSWVLMAIAGFFAGVIPLTFAIPVETPGVGPGKAGAAVGLLMASGNLGGFLFPALNGWISGSNPGVSASIFIIVLCFIIGYGGAGVLTWLLQETGSKLQQRT